MSVRKKSTDKKEKNKYLYSIIKGIIFGFSAFIVLICLFAFILTKADFSENQIRICAIVSAVLSSLISGFFSTRSIRKKGIYLGAASTIPLIIVVFLISLAFSGGNIGYTFFAVIPLMLLSGAIGGILAVNIRKKR